jgi:hypothetical protein
VLLTNNDSGYRAALDLAAAGTTVAAIIDLRPEADHELTEQARQRGIELLPTMPSSAPRASSASTGSRPCR